MVAAMTEVSLSAAELIQAATAGVWRHVQSLKNGYADRYGEANGDAGWQKHIEGAAGELAVAKLCEVYWPGAVGTFHGPDLGRQIQVRTRSKSDWDLIVRATDADEDVFVLVTGKAPTYDVRGAIMGWEAKQDEFRADHGGHGEAFFVPASSLHELKEVLS
jgi:hypothetical protein